MGQVGRPRLPLPPHGSRARYGHRSDGCKCDACSQANARYQAAYRAAVAPTPPRPATRVGWVQLEIPASVYQRVGR